jgi:anti-sigma28 factor (negative regulator of flagellin synthesis)
MNNINRVVDERVTNLNAQRKAENIKGKEKKPRVVESASDTRIKQDVVSISSQGMAAAGKAAEVNRYSEIIKTLPDVDQAKINEVSKKVKDGAYFTKEVADLTAKRIIEAMQQLGE